MSRKSIVFALAAVLVVAVAIPVVAQERLATPKLQKISKRALKQSRTALRISHAARRQASLGSREAAAASQQAGAAQQSAAQAASAAVNAQASVDSTRVQTDFAPGTVKTSSETFVSLLGGPSVEVTVPAPGLIEVWAQVTMLQSGAVALFEDGEKVPGQTEICGPEADPGSLLSVQSPLSEPIPVATPTGFGIGVCGSFGPPGPVLFETSPGTHTYELRYASCGCGGEEPTFSERRLFIGPRL